MFLDLHGSYQGDNFAAALAAAEAFFGSPLDDTLVREAAATVRSPGRLEIVGHDPLVILDGAKNLEGAERAAAAVQEEFGARSLILVVGMLYGKDPEAMLRALGAGRARLVVDLPSPVPPSPASTGTRRGSVASRGGSGGDGVCSGRPRSGIRSGRAGRSDPGHRFPLRGRGCPGRSRRAHLSSFAAGLARPGAERAHPGVSGHGAGKWARFGRVFAGKRARLAGVCPVWRRSGPRGRGRRRRRAWRHRPGGCGTPNRRRAWRHRPGGCGTPNRRHGPPTAGTARRPAACPPLPCCTREPHPCHL